VPSVVTRCGNGSYEEGLIELIEQLNMCWLATASSPSESCWLPVDMHVCHALDVERAENSTFHFVHSSSSSSQHDDDISNSCPIAMWTTRSLLAAIGRAETEIGPRLRSLPGKTVPLDCGRNLLAS
jgi:hypothetical protein